MKLRPPSVPLITIDPYFSIWAPDERLNARETVHWTGASNDIVGIIHVDGKAYSFLGYDRDITKMKQIEMDVDALSTRYTFECEQIKLYVRFTTPLLPDDLDILTRPISYMSVSYEKKIESVREVRVSVQAGDTLCINAHRAEDVVTEEVKADGFYGFKIGSVAQKILSRSGDNLRIEWGYFYLCTNGEGEISEYKKDGWIKQTRLFTNINEREERLFLFAYDDIASINYFGKHLKSYWNKDGKTIECAIGEAIADFPALKERCDAFSDKLAADAYMAGGAKYADILSLAYRQVIAAHKLVVDDDGEILFISKECFSNGCAATVDVSYPSTPMFLLYNTELVKGMMRPIYKFAASDAWKYDFAPHDAGQYPLVTGQVYGLDRATGELKFDMQMPVEECGNMIIMEANVALAEGNADFAASHIDTLKAWCEYLIKYGNDPENQLCTDDFAGHLAHNCNLSLKAIMGIMGMSIIMDMLGNKTDAENYKKTAKEMADSWCERAINSDGLSYRLAFDKDGSFSMKYNMVWDKIWGTGLFDKSVYERETASNISHINEYGMPLDSRAEYTKSDWLVWTATLAKNARDFKKFITPLWRFYNDTHDRNPMTDWYDTVTAVQVGMIHRSVQGGLFIKLLDHTKKLKTGEI